MWNKLGTKRRNLFKKLGDSVKGVIKNVGNKTANWIIKLRNEQIKKLESTVMVVIEENTKQEKSLNEAADLILDAELSMNKLGYENKVLEDLAYAKMRETIEARHELEILKKEKEIETKINAEE